VKVGGAKLARILQGLGAVTEVCWWDWEKNPEHGEVKEADREELRTEDHR